MSRKEIERAITEIVNIYCNSQAPLAETQRKMRQPIERLLADEREKAIAWGRVDQHKEDCEDIDCKYARVQGKRIKGCPKYLALQRQLDLTKYLAASSREEKG